jgi:regulator of sigma E protease
MAIISAGVIFNLIFGVLFATIAYSMGVKYTPCIIGTTSVGDPAWRAGIQPGDKIIQLRRDSEESQQLRFREDLQVTMFSVDPGEDLDLQLQSRDGEKRWVTLTPDSKFKTQVGTPTIGVVMAQSRQVYGIAPDSIASRAGMQPGDIVEAITVDGQSTAVSDGLDLQEVMARSQHKPITLTVSRIDPETKASSTHELKLGVGSGERFGIELRMGPITCIQSNSVAERAGIRVGDIITEINGQPISDPLTLPTRMLDEIGKTTALRVRRGESFVDLTLTPVAPKMMNSVRRRNAPIGLGTLGVGYVLMPTVDGVIAGSPAATVIQKGDVLKSVQLIIPEEPIAEEDKWPVFTGIQEHFHNQGNRKLLQAFELDKPVPIDEQNNNWPFVIATVQGSSTKFKVEVTFERDGKQKSVVMTPARSESMVDVSRGFGMMGIEDTLVAASFSQAFALGRREVWDGISQVVMVLQRIKSNYKNLGGPISIAAVATSEASAGLPQLLIFLTLLSANLAVLNFLPIPVLDGGHMVFLSYEGLVGKPVDERIAFGLTIVGFSLLMGLMVFVFGLDLNRFLG